MTLLPQVEQALVDGAARHYGRRRRVARATVRGAAALAATAAVAAGAALVAAPPDDVERAAPAQAPPSTSDTGVQALADAAGCTLAHPRVDGRGHLAKQFRPGDYSSNPPAGGDHSPDAAEDGVYGPGRTPAIGGLVHALEHGRINVQYRPGTPQRVVDRLEAFVAENDGYHMLLFESPSGMEAEVAATAWGHSLTCGEFGTATVDALRAFRDRYIDKGPERVP